MSVPASFDGRRVASSQGRVAASANRKPIGGIALLALVSTLLSLVLCEAGLRLFTRYGAPAWTRSPGELIGMRDAARYASRIPLARGTSLEWFTDDPPPLPNRAEVLPERRQRYDDYRRRGIFPPQADYIWNRYYLDSVRCGAEKPFGKFPQKVEVFDPPSVTLFPRYRFPPNVTTVGKLVTNGFGLRGRPLSLAKPPRTIRIAFLGASTTIGYHYFAFSYPERVVAWLNRFAEANHYDVRFEMLNGGREGINSHDVARILKDELLPLDPDLAVYYEGANQFASANDLVWPRIPARKQIDPHDPVVQHKLPETLRAHLALGNLADRALNGFQTAGEPLKPAYRLVWPAGVDERKPDADDPRLPLKLPEIIHDLDSIRADLNSTGARLVLSSYEWLAEGGMPLSPTRHRYIYEQLNTVLWPLRYSDIRRLADFQNLVFRRYAQARGIDFLDVAPRIPPDPDLFIDAIHMTEIGERLRAWITFQQLVPVVRRLIESGQLPRPAQTGLPAPPSLAISEATTRCGDAPAGPLVRAEGALSLDTIMLAYDKARIRFGDPVEVETAEAPSSHAGVIPFYIPQALPGPHYAMLRGRVVSGQISVGVLETVNGKHTDPQLEKLLTPELGDVSIYIPLTSPNFDAVVIANGAASPGRSKILIEDAALVAPAGLHASQLVKTVDLAQVKASDAKASVERSPAGVLVTTKLEQTTYAGHVALGLDAGAGPGLTVHIRARVLEGNVGFGILSRDERAFLQERTLWPSGKTAEIVVPLPSPPVTGDLIIRNWAAGGVRSRAIVERIEIRKTP